MKRLGRSELICKLFHRKHIVVSGEGCYLDYKCTKCGHEWIQ